MGRASARKAYREHAKPLAQAIATTTARHMALSTEVLRRGFFGRLKWLLFGR